MTTDTTTAPTGDAGPAITIGGRPVGDGHPVYVVAELSANHGGDLAKAMRLLRIAADAGADAVKLQTYTADSLTIDSDKPAFCVGAGTQWQGRRLYELYQEAATPDEWYGELLGEAKRLGLDLFSTPFSREAVDMLETFDPPAYKIASFEMIDLPLVQAIAATGRPVIMSTGMATVDEIDAAVGAVKAAGSGELVLLRCNSAYPARTDEMDLRTIEEMRRRWQVPVGLSDHTLDDVATLTAVALGACMIEKHFTERRSDGGPDSSFSLEPAELERLVRSIRSAEAALGGVRFGPSEAERSSLAFRRSLWVVEDVAAGDEVTERNVRSIRPAGGMAPARFNEVLGRRFALDVERGTALDEAQLVGLANPQA